MPWYIGRYRFKQCNCAWKIFVFRVWYFYNHFTAVYVPDGAFYDCTRLEAVVLTGGSEIGEDAFKYCDVLQGVYIPESITSIATTAFDESTRVKLAGADNSYVQEYANSNDLTFNPGYIACSYVVTRETKSGELNGYYAISEVTATNNESVCASDEYGYFVIFLLENGNYKCNWAINTELIRNLSLAYQVQIIFQQSLAKW